MLHPDSFQQKLLDSTGVPWSVDEQGVLLDFSLLTKEQFEELLGAGCFTYHLGRNTIDPYKINQMHFNVARNYPHFFVGEDYAVGSSIVQKSVLSEEQLGGIHVLGHKVFTDGVQTGFKVVWGQP